MKTRVALFLVSLSLITLPLAAQSASGRFVIKGDAGAQTIEFQAADNSGSMSFGGPVVVNDQDTDGEVRGTDKPTTVDLQLKIVIDCLVTEKNRASLGGVVRDASVPSYVGQRVLLTIEDNSQVADRYNWGVSRFTNLSWVPSDAELKYDDGAYLRWTATDAERKDDPGIPSQRSFDCRTVTLGSYLEDDLFFVADGSVLIK